MDKSHSDRNDVKHTQGVDQKEKTKDNPDDLQKLALDKHARDVIDHVEDKPGDEEGDECGNHSIVI
jgi:hypothetical protein